MPTKPSLAILVLGATAAAANAQCTNYWVPGYASGHVGAIDALTVLSDGDLVTGWADFAFLTAHVSRWNGSTWSEMTPPLTGGTFATIVAAFALLANGDLIVGGGFTQAGSVAARGIARWDGQNWHSLGIGLGGPPPGFATTLLLLDNGDLVVGGSFARAGGLPAPNIARWDGVAWSPMGAGLSGLVSALVQMPNGDVIAGGSIFPYGGVARWDGQSWNPVGGASGSVRVDTLAVTPNGDLFAGGWFDTIAGTTAANIARFDGSAWSAVGAGCDGPVNRLQVLPNGDLLAIGTFQNAGTLPAAGIARWDGQSWSALPAGFTTPKYDIDLLPDGDLVISGYSTERIQRLSTTCPATAMPTGAGCAGAAGPLVLAADGLPWSGTTFRARATGFPSAAFAVALYGLQPASTPLANVLPQALPGCTLWTSTESIALLPVVAGAAETRLTLPNTMAFAGVQLFHQVLAAELDPVGNLVAFTGSNALALVLGTW